MNRDINVKTNLKNIAEVINLNDVGALALYLQKKHYSKHNKKDSIEHILSTIKDVLLHGDNYDIINSSIFIEFILIEYIDKNLETIIEIDKTTKLTFIKVLKLSNCLDLNDNLIQDLKDFINENKEGPFYNFDRIRSYIYDNYYDNRKNININDL